MNEEDWRNHVLEGSTKGMDVQKLISIIEGWLRTYIAEAKTTIKSISEAEQSNAVIRAHHQKTEALRRRWTQIKEICESALKALSS